MPDLINLSTLAKHFADEDAAYQLMEQIRWPDGPVCPHCGVVGEHYYLAPESGTRKTRTGHETFRRVWKCSACHKQFSVLVRTIFEDSKIPLSKWLLAVHLMCASKNGVAANELHRTLGIAYRSAWFMCHRIRYAMGQEPLVSKLSGTVEAHETYFGGEAKNMHAKDRERKITGRGTSNKIPVVILVERDGNPRSQALKKVNRENSREILTNNVDDSAHIRTDQSSVYQGPTDTFASHETIDHSAGEYVRGDAHTNAAEEFFGQLKRSIDGTHHHVGERHLDRYLGEFDYRYNTRKMRDSQRTGQVIRRAASNRLKYEKPTEKIVPPTDS